MPDVPGSVLPEPRPGVGYYTGAIFNRAPGLDELARRRRSYDEMMGRSGTDARPRFLDLGLRAGARPRQAAGDEAADAVALLHRRHGARARLVALKSELIAQGLRVRLERAPQPQAAVRAARGIRISPGRHGFGRDTSHAADLDCRELDEPRDRRTGAPGAEDRTGCRTVLFRTGGGRYRSTVHAQGAWNPHEQHMAPVSGILTHCIERFQPQPGFRIARLSFEILGLIPDGEFEVVTTMLRPGRTIELVQAELIAGGRTAVRARAWRLQTSDTSAVAAIEDAAMAGKSHGSGPSEPLLDDRPGGYIRSIEIRAVAGHRSRQAARPGSAPSIRWSAASPRPTCALVGLVDAEQRHHHPGAAGARQFTCSRTSTCRCTSTGRTDRRVARPPELGDLGAEASASPPPCCTTSPARSVEPSRSSPSARS